MTVNRPNELFGGPLWSPLRQNSTPQEGVATEGHPYNDASKTLFRFRLGILGAGRVAPFCFNSLIPLEPVVFLSRSVH